MALVALLALTSTEADEGDVIVASASSAQNSHSATLLTDGRVLVAGGWSGTTAIANADLFDADARTWALTAPLLTPRIFHAATRLADGRVLVAGGWDNNGDILTSAEVYDPASAAWLPAAPLQHARAGHTALTLPDGRVLVVGGCFGSQASGAVSSPGQPWDVQAVAEVYDPRANSWQAAGQLAEGRCWPTATLLADGRVLVVGGADRTGRPVAGAELYDPNRNGWSSAGRLQVAREGHTATLLPDGQVLVAGGYNGEALASTELYNENERARSETGPSGYFLKSVKNDVKEIWTMSKQRMIRLGMGALLALNLIGVDTPSLSFPAQAQGLVTFDCAAVTEIPPQECDALVAFYTSTNGNNWLNHSGWLQTNTPCTWHGLTCNEGHVTQVELEWNYLQGALPPEIGDLAHLQVLSLPFSGITGSIPSEIGNLQQLRELRLTGNGFSGPIPATLGNLANLEGLFLHYNQLTGPIPRELGKLVNLDRLLLYSNQLSGPIPAELGSMSGLIFLKLQNNQLSGSIPPSLGQLTNLCDLDLSSNQLTGTIPHELGNLTRIGWCSHAPALHDIRNILSPTVPLLPDASRPPQPNIGYLNLAANHLSGAVPVELVNSPMHPASTSAATCCQEICHTLCLVSFAGVPWISTRSRDTIRSFIRIGTGI